MNEKLTLDEALKEAWAHQMFHILRLANQTASSEQCRKLVDQTWAAIAAKYPQAEGQG